MKGRSFLVWAVLAATAAAWGGAGVWTSGGPDGGPVADLAFDPTAAGSLYAATRHNAVFRSLDGAASWAGAGAGLERSIIALAAAADGTLYAVPGPEPLGLFKSSDGGASWQQVLGSLVTAVATDPSSAATVYAATSLGVVSRSTDAGASWTSSGAGLPDNPIRCLVVDPLTPATLYLCSEDSAAFKSTDSGATWTAKSQGISGVEILSMVIDPLTPAKLYVATNEGLFKTANGGDSWTAVSDPAEVFIRRLAIDPAVPSTLLAGASGRIFRSLNSGGAWSEISSGVPPAEMLALAVDPFSSSTYWAGTGAGVVKSLDSGASWSPANAGLRAVMIDRLAVDPATPATLYAGSPESGVFKSTDGGATWSEASQGLGDRSIADLALAPSAPQSLHAAQSLGLRRSLDGAATWTDAVSNPSVFGPLGPLVTSLGVDPQVEATVFAVSNSPVSQQGGGPGVFRSLDGGVTWERVYEPGELADVKPGEVVVSPADSNQVLAAFGGRELTPSGQQIFILRSLDGGDTWTEEHNEPDDAFVELAYDPLAPATAYALKEPGDAFSVLRSLDAGDSWSPLAVTAPCVEDLLPDPETAGTLWAACDPAWVSDDGGATWSPFDATGFPTGVGGALALARAVGVDGALHAGTAIGVWSYDLVTAPLADLAVTKDDGLTEIDPGAALSYTIVVSNLGPADALGAAVTDDLPAELACTWSCVGAGGGVCDPTPPAGDLDESVDLPVGATVTFTADCTVDPGAGGLLTNTAASAPPVDTVDPAAGNDAGTDTTVVLEPGPCGAFNDRHLSNVVLAASEIIEACVSIAAGPAVEVVSDVLFRAPRIELRDIAVTAGSLTMLNEVPTP